MDCYDSTLGYFKRPLLRVKMDNFVRDWTFSFSELPGNVRIEKIIEVLRLVGYLIENRTRA